MIQLLFTDVLWMFCSIYGFLKDVLSLTLSVSCAILFSASVSPVLYLGGNMTIQEMKCRKKELGYTNKDLARLTGVPLGTIEKIFGNTTSSPRRRTILALESVLSGSNQPEGAASYHFKEDAMVLSEPGFSYGSGTSAYKYPEGKKQGEFTLEDYLALPEDLRVELIDGVFYDMAAPFVLHQFIATQIGYQLMGYTEKTKGPCKPVLSPVDVQLDKDNKTVVQPDVLILCNPEILIRNGRVFGAPDFIIEILSRSTRKRDMTLKLMKYANAGVREYWIIDPERLSIVVYDLEHEELPALYNFKSDVPVKIWDGKFSVDFKAVYNYIKDYLEDPEPG